MVTQTADIVLTGGGSAGHVVPHLALLPELLAQEKVIHYIGSHTGIEKQLIADFNLPYHAITTTKLHREFNFKNITIPVQLTRGILQAKRILKKLKPKVVFSKGGYVALPVVIAAKFLNIPVIAHESDLTPGLANRLSAKYVDKIAVTFPESAQYFKYPEKIEPCGAVIRPSILAGDRRRGLAYCNFEADKPVLLVWGGGNGSVLINDCVRKALPLLTQSFQVIHICGKGKRDNTLDEMDDYVQFEYLNTDLPDVLACADVMVGRGGSNTLYEMLVLHKPHILIPLARASRGDQVENAAYFKAKKVSMVLPEADLSPQRLAKTTAALYQQRHEIVARMQQLNITQGRERLLKMIMDYSNQ